MFYHQRGPRYFDPPSDNVWGTCYNCGEEGHASFNCTAAKRKKPCFVCGSLSHNNGKKCIMVCLVCFSYSFFCLKELCILQLPTMYNKFDRFAWSLIFIDRRAESMVQGLFDCVGGQVILLLLQCMHHQAGLNATVHKMKLTNFSGMNFNHIIDYHIGLSALKNVYIMVYCLSRIIDFLLFSVGTVLLYLQASWSPKQRLSKEAHRWL